MTKPKARGAAVASAIVFAFLLGLLVFTAAGVAMSRMSLARAGTQDRVASLMAESAIEVAIGKLLADPEFGQHAETVHWYQPDDPASLGTVSFDPSQAAVPPSFNNLASDAPHAGWKRQVPKSSVQLIGTGVCGDVRRQVEAVVHVPPYNLVVGSTGPVHTRGTVVIARIKDLSVMRRGVTHLLPEDLLPGSVASNSADVGLDLKGYTTVKGDALATGPVDLGPEAVVEGSVESGARAATLPKIDIRHYDPRRRPGSYEEIAPGSVTSSLSVVNMRQVARSSLYVPGELMLEGGLLYVDGDLVVAGSVRGKGAVFATGRIEVQHGTELSTDNLVALASSRGVKLRGRDDTFFRGLVYTEGDFEAAHLTIIGSLAANSPAPGGSKLSLEDAHVIQERNAVVTFGTVGPSQMTFHYGDNGLDATARVPLPLPGEIRSIFEHPRYEQTPPFKPAVVLNSDQQDALQAFLGLGSGAIGEREVEIDAWQETAGAFGETQNFNFSFSELLAPADRYRVVLWRRL